MAKTDAVFSRYFWRPFNLNSRMVEIRFGEQLRLLYSNIHVLLHNIHFHFSMRILRMKKYSYVDGEFIIQYSKSTKTLICFYLLNFYISKQNIKMSAYRKPRLILSCHKTLRFVLLLSQNTILCKALLLWRSIFKQKIEQKRKSECETNNILSLILVFQKLNI